MKIEDRLPEALDRIARATPVNEYPRFDAGRPVSTTTNSRSRVLVAAAAIVVVGVAGLVAVTNRDGDSPVTEQPPTNATNTIASAIPTPSGAPAETAGPPGAMTLSATTRMSVEHVQQGRLRGDNPTRWYATNSVTPEAGAYLRVASSPNDVPAGSDPTCMLAATETTSVTLNDGSYACLEVRDPDVLMGRIAVDRGPEVIRIEGAATDAELLVAANHLVAEPTGAGYEIAPAGLPGQVELTGTGWLVSDFAATSFDAGDDKMIQVNWISETGASMFYVATTDAATWLPNLRLGYDTVADLTVRGVPAFTRTLPDQPNYLGLVWHENGITYQVGSQQLTQHELLELVEQMQPATASEWTALNETAARNLTEEAPDVTTAETVTSIGD